MGHVAKFGPDGPDVVGRVEGEGALLGVEVGQDLIESSEFHVGKFL